MSFNPRAPRGARPSRIWRLQCGQRFQSTRPARGATQKLRRHVADDRGFNPRAPRGARPRDCRASPLIRCFNPRAPRGARQSGSGWRERRYQFQSTRPARGATTEANQARSQERVSIHAPRAGRDADNRANFASGNRFQSTRPARGATRCVISVLVRWMSFNPRAPRGARRYGIFRVRLQ